MNSEQPTDQLIEQTLERNAEEVRRKFASKPNDRLTAMLIPRSTGMFATLSSKLLLLGGSALVVGTTLFITSSDRAEIDSPVRPATPTVEVQSVAAPAAMPETAEPSPLKQERAIVRTAKPATAATDPAPSVPTVNPSSKTPMTLDENGPVEQRTEPHIQPPVR